MISVTQAFDLIQSQTSLCQSTATPVSNSLNLVLSEPVTAPFHLPSFRQSAMDGYAVQLTTNNYVVSGTSKAGDTNQLPLIKGHARRIFTGAMVPDNADTVVIQEHVSRTNEHITIHKTPAKGANIRAIGEQIQRGDVILPAHHQLTPASIGLLAGFGITEVTVYKTPTVGILVTGNELLDSSEVMTAGKIYDSSSIMLRSALTHQGIHDVTIHRLPDDLHATATTIEKMLDSCDILLLSGGISVGDYDFVQEALTSSKVEEIFYTVKQKPGKPLWFGKKNSTTVFGLPGNPASALTCFYIYVWPAIAQMMGQPFTGDKWQSAILTTAVQSPQEKALFLKASYQKGNIKILGQQSSSMLQSFAMANAIAFVPEHFTTMAEGDPIQYNLIP